ncbi:MAG: squalene synthase HpnC [Burkholderiaceae bacterium]|nr:squalene synthase HpnC [Ideonella sp.]MCC7287183.1 squalene synthase HpnC [Burkholderiaceae bacterium]
MRAVGVGHYENFPVATLLCPPALRAPVRAIYAFARTGDDLADEGDWPAAHRLQQLARYRDALRATTAQAGGHTQPPSPTEWPEVFGPLATALRRYHLAPELLHALLDAFEQDVHNPPYADRAALLAYCSRSANPVGRLLLQLHGIDNAQALRESDAICSALQLINFWQDLSVDLPRGRDYVPRDDRARHGLAAQSPLHDTPAARALVRELVGWAATLMAEGAPLPLRVPGRAGWELRLVVHGGWRILERIARMEHRSFAVRPRLTLRDTPLLGWRALTYRPGWFDAGRLR